MKHFRFCLFSYNRAQHLENCIQSLQQCAKDFKVTIYDDNSDCLETQSVLRRYSDRYDIKQPKDLSLEGKFGGLYNNMQAAVDDAAETELLCFIQDDMQLVRTIDSSDVEYVNHYFSAHPESAFLHPAFLRGSNRSRDLKNTQWQSASRSYYRDKQDRSAGISFSAIIIVNVERVRKSSWKLEKKEQLNDRNAGEAFGRMGFMYSPFCVWLPNVPVFRGKQKTMALRFSEYFRKSGFYPIEYMTPKQIDDLKQRPEEQLPFAEDFLTLRDGKIQATPWIYYALQGWTIMKLLNRLEIFLNRKIRGS